MIYFYVLFVCYAPIVMYIVPPMLGEVKPTWLLFFLLLIVFIIRVAGGRERVRFNFWLGILAIFTLLNIFSVFWSDYATYNLYYIQRLFAKFAVPFLVAFIAVSLFHRQNNRNVYMKHICIAAAILGLISIIQIVTGTTPLGKGPRAVATFRNPNALSVFLMLCIPICLYMIENNAFKHNWFKFGTLGLMVTGILSTVSRKGILSMVLVFFIYLFFKQKYKVLVVVSILFLILGGAIFARKTYIAKRFENDDLSKRIDLMVVGLEMFKDHIPLGFGYEGFIDNVHKYINTPWYHREFSVHNHYVEILVNMGLVGFFFFLMIFLQPLYMAVVIRRNRASSKLSKDISVITICNIIPFMMSLFFMGGFFGNYTYIMIYYSNIALLFTADRAAVQTKQGREA